MPRAKINPENGLTAQQEEFCREYVRNNYKAPDAYEAVYTGCKRDTAWSNSSRLLKKPEVRAFIRELQKDAYEAANISAERLATKLAEMAFAEKGDEVYTPSVALKALDLLQKQLGLQTKNINQDTKTTISVVVEEPELAVDIEK